jgi:hypothetical protein
MLHECFACHIFAISMLAWRRSAARCLSTPQILCFTWLTRGYDAGTYVHYTSRVAPPPSGNSITAAVNGMLATTNPTFSLAASMRAATAPSTGFTVAMSPVQGVFALDDGAAKSVKGDQGLAAVWDKLQAGAPGAATAFGGKAPSKEPKRASAMRGASLSTKWSGFKQSLKLRSMSAASSTATGVAPPPQAASVQQASRAEALQAQVREAAGVYAAGVALMRSGRRLGLEWEESVGVVGGVVEADAAREDRWMLMPHEAAAAIRACEDLSWIEARRRAARNAPPPA